MSTLERPPSRDREIKQASHSETDQVRDEDSVVEGLIVLVLLALTASLVYGIYLLVASLYGWVTTLDKSTTSIDVPEPVIITPNPSPENGGGSGELYNDLNDLTWSACLNISKHDYLMEISDVDPLKQIRQKIVKNMKISESEYSEIAEAWATCGSPASPSANDCYCFAEQYSQVKNKQVQPKESFIGQSLGAELQIPIPRDGGTIEIHDFNISITTTNKLIKLGVLTPETKLISGDWISIDNMLSDSGIPSSARRKFNSILESGIKAANRESLPLLKATAAINAIRIKYLELSHVPFDDPKLRLLYADKFMRSCGVNYVPASLLPAKKVPHASSLPRLAGALSNTEKSVLSSLDAHSGFVLKSCVDALE
ncbi:hypothetical protein [Vibrio comitans]